MKLWIRKIFVAIVTIITLGIYVPPIDLHAENDSSKDSENIFDNLYTNQPKLERDISPDSTLVRTLDPVEEHLQSLSEEAEKQLKVKLGSKILSEIEEDVFEEIYPRILEVIEETVRSLDENKLSYLRITENPSGGIAERIFNVYDQETSRILLKFHVRRDQRPLEGHWFNFHYHVFDDRFEKHYEIGEIYWAKNDPPQWLS